MTIAAGLAWLGLLAGTAPFRVLYSNDLTDTYTCIPYHQPRQLFTAASDHRARSGPAPLRLAARGPAPAGLLCDGANSIDVTLTGGEALELAFVDLWLP